MTAEQHAQAAAQQQRRLQQRRDDDADGPSLRELRDANQARLRAIQRERDLRAQGPAPPETLPAPDPPV